MGSPHVGVVSDLDQDVWIVVAGGEQASGAVILEAAAEHPHALGRKRRGDRVAPVAGVSLPVPCERHVLLTVDHLAALRGKTVAHVRVW